MSELGSQNKKSDDFVHLTAILEEKGEVSDKSGKVDISWSNCGPI